MTEEPRQLPPNAIPYLLVVPSSAAVQWPGPDGQPAWAIPVTIPPGTPGYTVFIPLVPDAVQPAAPVDAPMDEPAGAAPKAAAAAEVTPAPEAVASPEVAAAHEATGQRVFAQPPLVPPAPPVKPAWEPAQPALPGQGRPYYSPLPARPGFLETRWRGPAAAHGWAVPFGVLIGALGYAVFLPLGRTGIGWFLGGLTIVVGVLVAVGRAIRSLPY